MTEKDANDSSETKTAYAASAPRPAPGKLAILTGMSFVASAIPVPLLPERVVIQIRGALAHDVASRHGLSLTSDARAAFAEGTGETPVKQLVKRTIGVLSRTIAKRLAPIATITTIGASLEVYALGVLLDRYIGHHRTSKTVRINAEEAREVRSAIDRAIYKAFSPSLSPAPVALLPPSEDLRDEFTRYVDTALLLSASLPGYVERRLTAAFDAIWHRDS